MGLGSVAAVDAEVLSILGRLRVLLSSDLASVCELISLFSGGDKEIEEHTRFPGRTAARGDGKTRRG